MAHNEITMKTAKIGVHQTHCCKKHGCKYGDKDCPVVTGEVKQNFDCENGDYSDPCFEPNADYNDEIENFLQGIHLVTENRPNNFYKYIQEIAKPEFQRLYDLDRAFEKMNSKSIKIMLRLNLSHRFVPNFGEDIKL